MTATHRGSVERQTLRAGRLQPPFTWIFATICAWGLSANAQPLQGGVSQDQFSSGSGGSRGRTTYPTGSQSRQPNDGPCSNPFGCGRGTGLPGAIGALGGVLNGGVNTGPNPPGRDVYCQQSPGQPMYGPYHGTGTNTPCGPNFSGTQAGPGLPPVGYGDEPPVPPVGAPEPPPFSVEPVLNAIDNCWTQIFLAKGKLFISPPASPQPAFRGSAAFLPPQRIVIYNQRILNFQAANYGAGSVIVTLAHEIGHSVQQQTGRLGRELMRKDAELQADMLAGVAMRCLDASGALETGTLGAAAWGRYVKGDSSTMPGFDKLAHGTPAERVNAFTKGYVQGLPRDFFGATFPQWLPGTNYNR